IPSRAAAIARQRASMSASVVRRARLHVGGGGALFELGAEALDELRVVSGLEDLVELAPVVGDETHALDRHVVNLPPGTPRDQPIVHGDLGALLGDDARADDGLLHVDALADVDDLLSAVELDPGDVRALEEIAE